MSDKNSKPFWHEVWHGYRPYLVKMIEDLAVSTTLWSVLFFFKWLTAVFAIKGWAGDFIINIHAAGAVCAFTLFVVLFLIDIYEIRTSISSSKASEWTS